MEIFPALAAVAEEEEMAIVEGPAEASQRGRIARHQAVVIFSRRPNPQPGSAFAGRTEIGQARAVGGDAEVRFLRPAVKGQAGDERRQIGPQGRDREERGGQKSRGDEAGEFPGTEGGLHGELLVLRSDAIPTYD